MDNAARALIIAAVILIAIILVAVCIKLLNPVKDTSLNANSVAGQINQTSTSASGDISNALSNLNGNKNNENSDKKIDYPVTGDLKFIYVNNENGTASITELNSEKNRTPKGSYEYEIDFRY